MPAKVVLNLINKEFILRDGSRPETCILCCEKINAYKCVYVVGHHWKLFIETVHIEALVAVLPFVARIARIASIAGIGYGDAVAAAFSHLFVARQGRQRFKINSDSRIDKESN
uniref:Uncharacterized protein n=1 Tax=Glossina brevipalpis TaxID=37001 RepID=A0A1A9X377_9MUSC